ncbi:GNAT family N-acetyltransferase [Oleiharenicola lentus]|uniref:GNAT family N-acetyltransferase n=1 Tax=Oleiharenicola lentus TaxID=2508720 RepID=UPI003F666F00
MAAIKLSLATAEDAEAIAALRNAISDHLTFNHGRGPWTVHHTTAGVLSDLRNAKLYAALRRDEVIASLKLATKKPWALDLKFFTPVEKPLYLTALCVAPEFQRRGYGRACLDEALKLARRAEAGAIFSNAFDHPTAGAGEFYANCGFKEVGRVTDRSTALRYYEMVSGNASAFLRGISRASFCVQSRFRVV